MFTTGEIELELGLGLGLVGRLPFYHKVRVCIRVSMAFTCT